MRPRYLLDSNVLAEPLRPIPNPWVVEKLERYQGEMGVAAAAWNEMLFGCWRLPPSRKRQAIERYLLESVRGTLPILPYDEEAARWHAQERARLAGLGKTPSYVDGLIAATACAHGAILVTANVSHFLNFENLAIEDWSRGPDE